jgi:hypothetical protein
MSATRCLVSPNGRHNFVAARDVLVVGCRGVQEERSCTFCLEVRFFPIDDPARVERFWIDLGYPAIVVNPARWRGVSGVTVSGAQMEAAAALPPGEMWRRSRQHDYHGGEV